jgi:hypothetical protein
MKCAEGEIEKEQEEEEENKEEESNSSLRCGAAPALEAVQYLLPVRHSPNRNPKAIQMVRVTSGVCRRNILSLRTRTFRMLSCCRFSRVDSSHARNVHATLRLVTAKQEKWRQI